MTQDLVGHGMGPRERREICEKAVMGERTETGCANRTGQGGSFEKMGRQI